jgi:hypothetical protein
MSEVRGYVCATVPFYEARMTRADEHLAQEMIRNAQFQNKIAKAEQKEFHSRAAPPLPREWVKPVRGAIPRQCGTDLEGFVIAGEPDKDEQAVLIVPLTDECVNNIYDRLVTAFAGIAARFDMAAAALAVIGIEKEPRRCAVLFQEDAPEAA